MIFVTVGTHEQQFDRLIKEVDELKKTGVINEDVFIQTGYSNYNPKYCDYKQLLPYDEMTEKVKQASIVITHGGPASFIMALQEHKIPIVVPRKFDFNEHVNNHQVEFTKFIAERNHNILPVYDIKNLRNLILNFADIQEKMTANGTFSNNDEFIKHFNEIVAEMNIL